jgi:RNA 2',3'-cyclic 3'-phosphodiesterase
MLRSFIAIELPAEIQEAIARSTAGLQKALPKPLVRWVVSRNIHLTLKFLGDVSPVNLEQLAEALKVEVSKHEPFDLSAGGIGAFPNTRQARVIWIGLEAQSGAATLQHCVEGVASRLGYPPEERPFSPHLTIGRVGQTGSAAELKSIRTALEACQVGALGTVKVETVHIFKSDLQPAGSVYTPLYSLPLKV